MEDMVIQIDKEKFKQWIESTGLKMTHISAIIGRSPSYISGVVNSGKISLSSIKLLQNELGMDPEQIKQNAGGPPTYSIDLSVSPDKVRMSINFGGQPLYRSYAKVNGDTELDLIKAISYAAHMCYKFAEQKSLEVK